MIEVAVVFSALASHWPDFYIILVLLVANAVVGFWEEYQAGNAIATLIATVWIVHAADMVGLGRRRLGVCTGLVSD